MNAAPHGFEQKPLHSSARLISYAVASPHNSIAQDEAAQLVQHLGLTQRWNKAVPALYRKSGVQRRGSVLLEREEGDPHARQSFYPMRTDDKPYGPTTSERMLAYGLHSGPLLLRACREALDKSNLPAEQITHLVTVSCTGFQAPGVDHVLFENLGLPATTQRTHIGFMGCHGMINGLRVAASFVESNPDAVVLVGAVELCSLHQQYSEDPEQIVANSLFADGAAAAILTGRSEKQPTWEIRSSFSVQISNSQDLMTWKVGDHGFAMTLSSQVPLRIAEDLKAPLCKWLSQHGVSIEQIDHWVVHPGGPRILDGVIDSLQLPPDSLAASRHILANHGNMSSPTVMFIFDEVLKRNASVNESQHCLMLGFGPGLHAEALLLVKPQQAPQ